MEFFSVHFCVILSNKAHISVIISHLAKWKFIDCSSRSTTTVQNELVSIWSHTSNGILGESKTLLKIIIKITIETKRNLDVPDAASFKILQLTFVRPNNNASISHSGKFWPVPLITDTVTVVEPSTILPHTYSQRWAGCRMSTNVSTMASSTF